MAIPETQLETWSNIGAVTGSSTTYNTIKNVLESSNTPYADKNFKVFLQGSYGNDTNIYAESDVDIVIKLEDCFFSDLEWLSDNEKELYKKAGFIDAVYTHIDFKKDVLKVLTDNYKKDVNPGKKAIEITASGNRRKTDVIAAIQFRRYYKFNGSTTDNSFIDGICFFTATGGRIVNYPKLHSANLTTKHQDSNGWLKPMSRILKNMRTKLVNDGHIEAGVAPSYFLEGLLYNVPNDKFASSYQDCFINAMTWIQTEADKDKLLCANEQYYLLRDNMPTSWSKTNGETFLNAAINLWNNW